MKVFLSFLAGCALLLVLSFGLGLFGKGVDTASKMADQTIFNADKHVYSYEDFRKKHNTFIQFVRQAVDARTMMDELDGKGRSDSQEYSNYNMEFQGAMQMMAKIAADYNAMNAIAYQGIWKGKSMPERLDKPSIAQIKRWAAEGLPREGYNDL